MTLRGTVALAAEQGTVGAAAVQVARLAVAVDAGLILSGGEPSDHIPALRAVEAGKGVDKACHPEVPGGKEGR